MVPQSRAFVAAMLDGSHDLRYIARSFYRGEQTSDDLELAPTGSLKWRGGSKVQASGRALIMDNRDRGLYPTRMTSKLAPFGQELEIRLEVSLGTDYAEQVTLGRFRITETPDMARTRMKYRGTTFVDSVAVEVALKDIFEAINEDDFPAPESPHRGATAWEEIRRLSPVPVLRSLPDVPVPASLVYDDNRLDAITTLMTALGGVPHITRQGALTARLETPDISAVNIDMVGKVQTLTNAMSIDGLKNWVVVTTDTPNGQEIIGSAPITVGPLSIYGPLGRRVERYSDRTITDTSAGQAAAEQRLASLSRIAKTVRVTCLPDPRVELGDVVRAVDPDSGQDETGIVDDITLSLDPSDLMTLDLVIPNSEVPW